jgi:hypothetical protein
MQRPVSLHNGKALRIIIASLLTAIAATATEISRTWHSQDGRTIEARIIKNAATERTVTLERDDGLRFDLSWDRLSSADQEYLSRWAATNTPPSNKSASMTDSTRTVAPLQALPEKVELKDVPMVQQKGNYCVPASATMIAGFHGINTNQDQVAELSSEMSAGNQGTYPSDMLLAMEKLGFSGHSLNWQDESDFMNQVLPKIRRALFETGPIYISFKPNVFGRMGHGCVIVGYDDRKEELLFYNPWGNTFESAYTRVAIDGYGVVFIEAPEPAPVASSAFVKKIQKLIPKLNGNFIALSHQLTQLQQAHELVWCSRRDARDDKRFARNTARDDGRKILELAFERNPAVLIPESKNGTTEAYLFVTRPPDGGARFLVRRIDSNGWEPAELMTLGSLTRNWVSRFSVQGSDEKVWELPMIELQPDPSL